MSGYSLILLDSIVLGAILFLTKAYIQKRSNRTGLPYPPGPPGYPIIGNVLDIPKEAAWETYSKWGKQYGVSCTLQVVNGRNAELKRDNIISINALRQTIVIINSLEIAKDLFEKRGAIYIDRPPLPVIVFC
jgi:hypothetical protein